MRLGIDIDGVCANWSKKARQMLNNRFELDLDECGDFPHWDWLEENITKHQWNWLWSAGVDRGLFSSLEILPGAYESLERLTEEHEVYLLTMRPKRSRVDTIWWVANNLDLNFQGVVTTNEKWKIECDVYLDDKPENVQAISDNRFGSYSVLFRREYNRDFVWKPDVENWAEFERFVKVLERRLI